MGLIGKGVSKQNNAYIVYILLLTVLGLSFVFFFSLSASQNLPQRLGSLLRQNDSSGVNQQKQVQAKLNGDEIFCINYDNVLYVTEISFLAQWLFYSKAEAQLQEKSSISNLQQLNDQTIEMLGLWRVLYDHQFHVIASTLTKVSSLS